LATIFERTATRSGCPRNDDLEIAALDLIVAPGVLDPDGGVGRQDREHLFVSRREAAIEIGRTDAENADDPVVELQGNQEGRDEEILAEGGSLGARPGLARSDQKGPGRLQHLPPHARVGVKEGSQRRLGRDAPRSAKDELGPLVGAKEEVHVLRTDLLLRLVDDAIENRRKFERRADRQRKLMELDRVLEGQVLGDQLPVRQSPGHEQGQRLEIQRLLDEVEGPFLHDLHGRIEGAVGRHDHADEPGIALQALPDQLTARHARHHEIGQQDIVAFHREAPRGRWPVPSRADLVAVLFQRESDRLENVRIIIDDQDPAGSHGHTSVPGPGSLPASPAAPHSGRERPARDPRGYRQEGRSD
jgi:hypothetical protein